VIIVDANVLVYAADTGSPHHDTAAAWLHGKLAGPETVGFSWNVLLAFLRLVTNPRLFEQPASVEAAISAVDAWLSGPNALLVEPTSRHTDLLKSLLAESGTAGNLVNDAHLAALAIEHDATIGSFDADFARFTGVRWERPG
jgi:toxin-antitoxin system PIN domain toxin